MHHLTAQELYAQLYDVYVSDWEGEIEFYQELLKDASVNSSNVLEIACGTGRVTMHLAKNGVSITGLDISPELLKVAQEKSIGSSNIHWVLGDMRTFEIGKTFNYIIIPGHSFQFMNSPEEQVKCLEQIKHHLAPNGLIVIHLDHQDFSWLGGLLSQKDISYKKGKIHTHPITQEKFRQSFAWTFEPSTQTATVNINWEQIDKNGGVIQVWEMEPMRLHCAFRFEIEHLLRRVGFTIEAVYGDFSKNELTDNSEQMIWLARNAG